MRIAAQMKVSWGFSPQNCFISTGARNNRFRLNGAGAARQMMERRNGEMEIFRKIEFNFMESWENENKRKKWGRKSKLHETKKPSGLINFWRLFFSSISHLWLFLTHSPSSMNFLSIQKLFSFGFISFVLLFSISIEKRNGILSRTRVVTKSFNEQERKFNEKFQSRWNVFRVNGRFFWSNFGFVTLFGLLSIF